MRGNLTTQRVRTQEQRQTLQVLQGLHRVRSARKTQRVRSETRADRPRCPNLIKRHHRPDRVRSEDLDPASGRGKRRHGGLHAVHAARLGPEHPKGSEPHLRHRMRTRLRALHRLDKDIRVRSRSHPGTDHIRSASRPEGLQGVDGQRGAD